MTTETETTNTEPETDRGSSSGNTAHDDHLARATKQRDAAKTRARDLERELSEARARLDEFDQKAQEREHDIARKAGEFGKIEETYKKQIAERDARLAEAETREQKRIAAGRESALAEAVARNTGIAERLVRGQLKLAADEGFDAAPVDATPDVVAEAIARIKADTPSLFTTRSTPAANGGTTDNADIPAEFASDPKKRAAYELGKRMSPHAQRK
jgi:chromosome segregation ATPase